MQVLLVATQLVTNLMYTIVILNRPFTNTLTLNRSLT